MKTRARAIIITKMSKDLVQKINKGSMFLPVLPSVIFKT